MDRLDSEALNRLYETILSLRTGEECYDFFDDLCTIRERKDLAQRLGLPAGEQTASYEFRSGDLPPHGYVPVRYDAAMTFWLTVGPADGGTTVKIDIGTYEDGRFYTGTNCTTADRITFFVSGSDAGEDPEPIDFIKS